MNNELINSCVIYTKEDNSDITYKIKEFLRLIKEIGYKSDLIYTQTINEINKATYIGSGKLKEIAADIENNGFLQSNFVIFCCFNLTAVQKKNISNITKCIVVDRSEVILSIFEKNAKTKEAKLQVEIAKLYYLKTHLIDNKASYSQVTSGTGHNKGSGEKEIELKRRRIEVSIHQKEIELKEIKKDRSTSRVNRNNCVYPKIAIVGYTNAGKSTLLNRLLKESKANDNKVVLQKDALFATLETSTRLIQIHELPSFIITDTVGFVSDLPIYLIDAFRSTLEEISEADLIVQVVDSSSQCLSEQIETTNKVLNDLGAEKCPMVYLYNKFDIANKVLSKLPCENEMIVSLAEENESIIDIVKFFFHHISMKWRKTILLFPYEMNFCEFEKENFIISKFNKDNGYLCKVYLNPKTEYKYKIYEI